MNILLIDDHSMFAESLARSLKKYDVISSVDIITDLDESLGTLAEKIINFKFDIILMDINLTKESALDGFDLAEELLILDKNLKIIMLTAFDMPMYIGICPCI